MASYSHSYCVCSAHLGKRSSKATRAVYWFPEIHHKILKDNWTQLLHTTTFVRWFPSTFSTPGDLIYRSCVALYASALYLFACIVRGVNFHVLHTNTSALSERGVGNEDVALPMWKQASSACKSGIHGCSIVSIRQFVLLSLWSDWMKCILEAMHQMRALRTLASHESCPCLVIWILS